MLPEPAKFLDARKDIMNSSCSQGEHTHGNLPNKTRLMLFKSRLLALAGICLAGPTVVSAQTFSEAEMSAFTDRYCSSCHNDVDKEGGLDLTTFPYAPTDAANFLTWVKVHDRVRAVEMPPP